MATKSEIAASWCRKFQGVTTSLFTCQSSFFFIVMGNLLTQLIFLFSVPSTMAHINTPKTWYVQNKSRISIINKENILQKLPATRCFTRQKVGFTPKSPMAWSLHAALVIWTMGVHFIYITCDTTAATILRRSVSCAFKRMRVMPNLLVERVCSKPTNDVCRLSFSVGQRHFARNVAPNTKTWQEKIFFSGLLLVGNVLP